MTPHGRSLCPSCWARREAKRREIREQGGGAKGVASESSAADSTSFEALMGGDAPTYETKPETPAAQESAPAAKRRAEESSASHTTLGVDEAGDSVTTKPKQFHRDVPVREALEIDPRRPILTQSGYQAPSKLAYLAAFIFFGIAGIFFVNSSPRVQDMMFPFDLGGIEYDENMRPVDQDTNALRNSSNISNFSLMRDLPLFILTWAIVLVYIWGAFLVIKEVVPTLYQRWKGWRNEQRMGGAGGL